jgi:hypothetical protein
MIEALNKTAAHRSFVSTAYLRYVISLYNRQRVDCLYHSHIDYRNMVGYLAGRIIASSL